MKKRIKKYGNAKVITFTTEEMGIHGWEVGDVIEIGEPSICDGEDRK